MKVLLTIISCLILTTGLSQDIKEIDKTKKEKTITIKGQILNRENNESIPFATLILKENEIYRVADENGFFELKVNNAILKSASVEISSMGFEPKNILLNELEDKTFLNPKFEELAEVIISGYTSPTTVLKKAISKIKENHPVEPFNFYRYGKVLINKNDKTELDLELITKDYDQGYLSSYVITQKVEEIKWNINTNPKRYENSSQLKGFRENPIRYGYILDKRKHKNFKLNFVKSNDDSDLNFHIIAFQTDRTKSNYTGRYYPTKYSGRIFIDKESFAIVKVIENWETTLNEQELEKYIQESDRTIYENQKNIIQRTIKEESISYYSDINNNGKLFAIRFFNRIYNETINEKQEKRNEVIESDSYFFDFEFDNIEEIEYYESNNKEENSLIKAKYDENFWNSFDKRKMNITSE